MSESATPPKGQDDTPIWELHDKDFPYEPDDACPYCMGEAHSLRHDEILARLEKL